MYTYPRILNGRRIPSHNPAGQSRPPLGIVIQQHTDQGGHRAQHEHHNQERTCIGSGQNGVTSIPRCVSRRNCLPMADEATGSGVTSGWLRVLLSGSMPRNGQMSGVSTIRTSVHSSVCNVHQ